MGDWRRQLHMKVMAAAMFGSLMMDENHIRGTHCSVQCYPEPQPMADTNTQGSEPKQAFPGKVCGGALLLWWKNMGEVMMVHLKKEEAHPRFGCNQKAITSGRSRSREPEGGATIQKHLAHPGRNIWWWRFLRR